MDDPRWIELDAQSKQGMINAAFADQVVSDPRWDSLEDNEKQYMHNSYLQDAKTYDMEVSPHAEGFVGAVKSGVKQTANSLRTAFNVVTNDEAEVEKLTQDASKILKTPQQQLFEEALQSRKTDDNVNATGWDSFKQGVSNVAGAAWEKPLGALHEAAGQVPNAGVIVGGALAGSALAGGALAGGMVAGIAGGIVGTLFGNTALETGGIAQDQTNAGNYDRADVLKKGAIKGAALTAFDVASIGLSKAIFTPAFKAVNKASQTAMQEVLKASKINPFDDAAVRVALAQDQALKTAVMNAGAKAAAEAAPKGIKGAGLFGTGMAIDTTMEGFGEYYSSKLAGLDANATDAILEAAMSIPHGVAEVSIGKTLAKAKEILPQSVGGDVSNIGAAQTTDEAVQAFESSISADLDTVMAKHVDPGGILSREQKVSQIRQESDQFGQFQEAFRDQKVNQFEQNLKQAQDDIQEYPDLPPIQPDVESLRKEWEERRASAQTNAPATSRSQLIADESNTFDDFLYNIQSESFEDGLRKAQADIKQPQQQSPIQPDVDALRLEYESRQADVRARQMSAPGSAPGREYELQQATNATDVSTMSQSEINSEIKRLGNVLEDYNSGVIKNIDERIIERYQSLVDEESGRRTGEKSEDFKKDSWFESKVKADKYLASLGYKNEGDSYLSSGKPHANIEKGGMHQGGFTVKFSDYPGDVEDDIKKAARILDKTENEVKRQYATVLDKYGVDEANRLLRINIEREINNGQAQDITLSLKDEKQRSFVDQRISKLGSIEAVDKAYNRDDQVSRYARAKAREFYGGEVLKTEITKEPWEMTRDEYVENNFNVDRESTYIDEIKAVSRGHKPSHYGAIRNDNAISAAKKDSSLKVYEDVTKSGDYIVVKDTESGRKTANELISLSQKRADIFSSKDIELIDEWNQKFSELMGYDQALINSIRDVSGRGNLKLEAARVHKYKIQEALKAGRNIPKSVLKDYPDLKTDTPGASDASAQQESTPTNNGNLSVAPGQAVTWKDKKGKSFSGEVVQKQGKSGQVWQVIKPDGKKTFVHEKNFYVVDKGAPVESENIHNFDTMVKEAARWRGAAMNVAERVSGDKKKALALSKQTTKGDLDAYLIKKYDIDELTARDVSNELTRKDIKPDKTAALDDFKNEPWYHLGSNTIESGPELSGRGSQNPKNDPQSGLPPTDEPQSYEDKQGSLFEEQTDQRRIPGSKTGDLAGGNERRYADTGGKEISSQQEVKPSVLPTNKLDKQEPKQEPWMQTQEDYLKSNKIDLKNRNKKGDAITAHLQSVKEAYRNGLNVPEENLKRYGLSGEDPEMDALERFDAKQKAKDKDTYGAKNKVFTAEAADKARDLLRKKLSGNQLNSGIDPEIMLAGIQLAGYHIEAGARTFAEYSKAMIQDVGDAVKPYLRSFYEGVRHFPEFDSGGMTSSIELDGKTESGNIDNYTTEENKNVAQYDTGTDSERNRGNSRTIDGLGEENISDGSGPATGADGTGVRSVDKEGVSGRGEGSPGYETPPAGKRGDQSPYSTDGPDGPEGSNAGSDNDTRGGDVGFDGKQPDRIPTKGVVDTAQKGSDLESKIADQKKAARIKTVNADLSNIETTLPILHPGQHEDVLFAETRFLKPDGHGVMLTNGTGTGKTFSGLGIIKRFERDGKKNILVIAPDNVIINAWTKAARLFDISMHKLYDTKDVGQDITITTYANFRDNKTLVSRDWDLVIADESHELSMNKAGGKTESLTMFRAITKHPRGVQDRAEFLHPDLFAARGDSKKADDAWQKALDEVRQDVSNSQQSKAVFLSATPFAYEKNIDYAEGYLFNYGADRDNIGYNSTDAYQQFMVEHFGYRMRYNKLTEPDAEVDRGVMQRQFNSWLKKEGALSSRVLSVDYDYDRRFILTESAVGQKIDDGFAFLHENYKEYNELTSFIKDGFDYLQRRYLLEAIKAKEVIPIIKDHLAHGRKVVVFHDYIKGGTTNPFNVKELIDSDFYNGKLKEQAEKLTDARPDLVNLPIKNLPAPLATLKAAFPGLLVVNGQTVSKKEMQENINTFNDDASGPCVLMVQSDKDKGWSGHDTTGKHQRVLINLGLPTRPTRAIQQEGRIYRVGQASDVMFRYLNTGTNWERWAFASTIAQRASAAENLAMGESARSLQDSFIDAFEASDNYHAGMPNEGKGGKEQDATNNAALTEWDRATSFYFGQQKKTARTKAKEGKDYFATPEPLGLKMVEWAGIESGDSVLEPSAGHGAIARWFPGNVDVTAIEPSDELSSRLKMVAPDAKVLQDDFENHHLTNKYDAIMMNPPFGSAGKTAMEHVEKAFKHLRDGGRLVAIVPRGPAMNKRVDKFLYGEDLDGKLLNPNAHLMAEFLLPESTFERAGTKVVSRVIIIDKKAGDVKPYHQLSLDYSGAKDLKEFFARIENSGAPARITTEERDSAKYSTSTDKKVNTDSDSFREWFGDSQVVDENGEPLVVYHGTNAHVTQFKKKYLGYETESGPAQRIAKIGFWFNEKPMAMREYSRESAGTNYKADMPVYLSIQEPFHTSLYDLFNYAEKRKDIEQYIKDIKADGYDGLSVNDSEFGGISYVAFSPTQIKSIYNTGTWDGSNPDIRYQIDSTPGQFLTLDQIKDIPIDDGRIIIRFSDAIDEDLSRGWSGFMGERSDNSPQDAVMQEFGQDLKFEEINNNLYFFYGEDGEKLGEVRKDNNTGDWVHVDHDGVAGFAIETDEYGDTVGEIIESLKNTPYHQWDFYESTDEGKIWKEDNPVVLFSGDAGENKNINIILVGASKETLNKFKKQLTTNAPISKLQTKIDSLPGKGLSIDQIKSQYKNQQITTQKDGTLSIRFTNGKGVKIRAVDHIGGDDIQVALKSGRMDRGGVILGKYQDGEITFNMNMANIGTAIHENYHALKALGMITPADEKTLNHFTKMLKSQKKYRYDIQEDMEENQANTLAQLVADRKNYREGSNVHALIQKLMDFFDALVHIGRQSARKLAREYESGDIYGREAETKSNQLLDGAQYSVSSDVTEEEQATAYSQILSGLKNVISNRKNKGPEYKPDIGVIEGNLGLMSHYSEGIPAMKRTFDELLKRSEWKFEKENELSKNGKESMIGTMDDLKKHNKSAYSSLKKYLLDRDINQIGSVLYQDEDGGWTIKSPKDEKTGKRTVLEEGIATKREARKLAIQYEIDAYPDPAGRDALRAFRSLTANLHDFYAKSWEDIVKDYEERGLSLPQVVTRTKSGEVRIDLKVALAQMGDRSSYYFPRQRSNGDWMVHAEKKGEHDFIEYRDSKIGADYLAGKLKAQGYTIKAHEVDGQIIEGPQKVGGISEDLYQGVKNILATQSMVNQALSETKLDAKQRTLGDIGLSGEWRGKDYFIPNGGVYEWSSSVLKDLGGREYSDHGKDGRSWSPGYWFESAPKDIEELVTNALYVSRGQETDVSFEISQSLANQLTDTLRARGSRARMIARSDAIGKDVHIGYETDPVSAIAQAVNSAAGGYAKQQVAMNTSKAITGQHYTWAEWQEQHNDYDALVSAEDELSALKKNSETEEERIADIDREIKDLQRERTGVATESEKSRQDRLFRIGKLFREKEKIRKWENDKQAAKLHQDIARLRSNIHKAYREYIQDNMLDPKRQKRAYTDAVNAVENVLKNDEAGDRAINTLKGLASVWFLGGRVSSAAINLTAMGTTVPAAMDAYGDIPLQRTMKHIVKAGKAYMSFVTGKGNVSQSDRLILEDIFSRGWVAAQLNMETVNALKSGPAQKYGKAVELLMIPFKVTEEFNRGTTILAAYKGIMAENPGMNREDALLKAKKVSDRAHGIYGVENQPALLRKGRGLRAASAMYIFQTYMHNYLTTLAYMIGRKQAKAATYMLLSPMVFGGAASSLLMPAIKMIFKAMDEDDPEEKIYQIAEELFGEAGGDVARYGLPGLAGVSLKGSLAPNLPDFQEPLDILGPIGGMMRNIYDGAVNITHGDYLKGIEKISPLAMGNVVKAYREVSEGVTTRSGDPVFFGNEPIKGDLGTGIMRAAGFNPIKIAKPREIQWNETTLKQQYAEMKRDIYSRIVRYHAQPVTKKDPDEWHEIVSEIKKFNARVKSHGLTDIVPQITGKTIKARMRRAYRPNKRERERA